MRLLSIIALMGAFILGCVNSSDDPLPEGQTYPVVVARGEFVAFDSRGGDCAACLTLTYVSTEDGTLHRRVFYVNADNYVTQSEPDMVAVPEMPYPGNHIVITRTGVSAYTVSKEE